MTTNNGALRTDVPACTAPQSAQHALKVVAVARTRDGRIVACGLCVHCGCSTLAAYQIDGDITSVALLPSQGAVGNVV